MNGRTTRGDFTRQAEFYGRARPGYPEAFVAELIEDAGVSAGDAVLELGAGTGLFTRLISGRGFTITATDPNPSMRALAPALPDATFRDGSFDATNVADGSHGWAVAAQAFHWADPSRALPEIRRALAPRRSFTVLWNVRDVARSTVLAWTLERVAAIAPGFDEGYRFVDWGAVLTSTGDFVDAKARETAHAVRMSAERYLDLWRSHNHLNSTAAPEDVRGLLAEIEARLAQLDLAELDVPYVCRAWTARAR